MKLSSVTQLSHFHLSLFMCFKSLCSHYDYHDCYYDSLGLIDHANAVVYNELGPICRAGFAAHPND